MPEHRRGTPTDASTVMAPLASVVCDVQHGRRRVSCPLTQMSLCDVWPYSSMITSQDPTIPCSIVFGRVLCWQTRPNPDGLRRLMVNKATNIVTVGRKYCENMI